MYLTIERLLVKDVDLSALIWTPIEVNQDKIWLSLFGEIGQWDSELFCQIIFNFKSSAMASKLQL